MAFILYVLFVAVHLKVQVRRTRKLWRTRVRRNKSIIVVMQPGT